MSITGFRIFPMRPLRHTQLAGMMFLQFVVMGCTLPIISLYMKDTLHFSGVQTGSILAFSAIASFFSPLLVSLVADRFIAAERLLSILHFVSAALMIICIQQTDFTLFLIVFTLYTIVINPAGALTNAICFHHLHDRNIFGDIRLWGTIGWIAAAWIFSAIASSNRTFLISNDLQGALWLSVIASIVLSIYALFLPRGINLFPQLNTTGIDQYISIFLNPVKLLKVIILKAAFNPMFLILSLFACGIMLVDRFYVFGAAPFVRSIGYAESDILSILSIGQIPEIFILLILSIILKHIGFKATVLTGIGLEIVRFSLFASGTGELMLFSGIVVHGVTWALIFAPITIYIDRQSTFETRADIQQLYSFISGNGVIAGNLIAGFCIDMTSSQQGIVNYRIYWIVPLIISAVLFIVFAVFFRDTSKEHY